LQCKHLSEGLGGIARQLQPTPWLPFNPGEEKHPKGRRSEPEEEASFGSYRRKSTRRKPRFSNRPFLVGFSSPLTTWRTLTHAGAGQYRWSLPTRGLTMKGCPQCEQRRDRGRLDFGFMTRRDLRSTVAPCSRRGAGGPLARMNVSRLTASGTCVRVGVVGGVGVMAGGPVARR